MQTLTSLYFNQIIIAHWLGKLTYETAVVCQ